jgi:methylmalonyl-CoA/ethylmalonyl-CoA epimerase
MLTEFIFNHIGIATSSIAATSKYYTEAGYNSTEIIYDPIQQVNICFLNKKGFPTIELIEPASESSPVINIVNKNGVAPYHFCYKVENIDEVISKLKRKNFVPLSKPIPAIAFGNNKICFLYNKDVGLIELVEETKE